MAAHQLVYHWKHGWIPRDHFAALQKAHGSHKGAARIMQRHGIEHPSVRHAGKLPVAAKRSGPKRFSVDKVHQRLIDRGIAGGSTHVVRDNHDGGNVARHENGGLAYFKSHAEAKRFAETHNARHDADREASPQELHRREMARIDAKDARARRAVGESFAASQRAARQKSLQEKAARRVAERRRLAESAAAGHTGNDAAISIRKNGSKYETFHAPSGLRITEHSSKSDAELTRKEMVATPHNLNVTADELRKSPAMEHLRTSAERAREDEQRKKSEASRVAAAKKLRPAGAPVSNPSKPGDLAVFSTKDRVAVIGKSDGVVERHTPGVVTHVGKDGRVVAIRDARGDLHTIDHRTEVRTMPQDQIDAHGLMAHVAATHRYGTSEHLKTHYDSMAEVQAAARQFRKDGPDAPAAAAVVSVHLDANRQGRLKSYSTPVLEGMLARADVSAQSKAFIRALLAERRARTSNRAG